MPLIHTYTHKPTDIQTHTFASNAFDSHTQQTQTQTHSEQYSKDVSQSGGRGCSTRSHKHTHTRTFARRVSICYWHTGIIGGAGGAIAQAMSLYTSKTTVADFYMYFIAYGGFFGRRKRVKERERESVAIICCVECCDEYTAFKVRKPNNANTLRTEYEYNV